MDTDFYPIENYEGLYVINRLGVVKTLKRQGTDERILVGSVDRTGYRRVALMRNGVSKSYAVHRLVCVMFLPNPEKKRTVNHKDGNKLNNCLDNLEWATHSENHKHAYKELGRTSHMAGKAGVLHHNAKQVTRIDKVTGEISYFCTVKEAALSGNFCMGHISACCNNTRNSHRGFLWQFTKIPDDNRLVS